MKALFNTRSRRFIASRPTSARTSSASTKSSSSDWCPQRWHDPSRRKSILAGPTSGIDSIPVKERTCRLVRQRSYRTSSRRCPVRKQSRLIERDHTRRLAVLHARLSAGRKNWPRRAGRRRGRQHVSRFRRGNRRRRHRALPSASGRRHSEAGRRTDSHVLHGFLLSEHGRAGREACFDRAGQGRRSASISETPARKPIEAAMKLARYHTRRDKFIAFHGCFHGRTMGALSLTASKAVQRKGFGSLLAGVFHAPYPNTYRGAYGVRPENAAADALSLSRERTIQAPRGSRGSCRQFSSSRFRAKAAICRRRRNSCRVSSASAASTAFCWSPTKCNPAWAAPASGGRRDHAGIEPDIICTAKGIASGMPLSAIIAKADVMDWKPGAHASTFGGNPVSHCGSACDDRLARGRIHRQCRAHGRIHLPANRRLARDDTRSSATFAARA